MKELLTDLYKKLAGFFQTPEKENVKEVACNRLKLVLMQDRTNLTPQLLERMRGELVDLLSRYVEMDKEALELNFAQEGDSMALMLSIPVLRAKEEEEIQALLDAEDEAKIEEEISEEDQEETEEVDTEVDAESEETEEEEVCACGCEECEECACGDECECEEEQEQEETTSKKSKKNN